MISSSKAYFYWKRLLVVLLVFSLGLGLVPVGTIGEREARADYAADLFISEYIEGSSNNKAIEIYNGTANEVNLSDYTLELYTNGSQTASQTLLLSGNLASGEVYVMCNTSAAQAIKDKADLQNSSVINFNGDDAIVLKHNGNIIDVIGKVGEDPGTAWGTGDNTTADHTLVRKSSISAGDSNPYDDFDPADQWDAYPKDTFDYLGSHTMDGFGSSREDTQPPVLNSAEISRDRLVIIYNEILDEASAPAVNDFTVKVNGQAQATPTNVAISGSTVNLTLAEAVKAGDNVTISYIAGTNPIQDAAGNDAADFTDQEVTNNTPGLFTISEARASANNTTVTTRGEVTAVLGTSAWIQDNTAGIRLYKGNITNVQIGQEVEATGTVNDFNGDRQITVSSYIILPGDNFPTPEPISVTIDEIGEENEGKLIKIENAWITEDYNTGSGGIYITTDGSNRLLVYAQAGSEIKTYLQGLAKSESNKYNFVGISSCYKDSRELFPRSTDDIQIISETTDPVILNYGPQGTITERKPEIYTEFTWRENAGPGFVSLKLNGTEVSNNASVIDSVYKISYIPTTDLDIGDQTVSVSIYNNKGGLITHTWSFKIESAQEPQVIPINQVDTVDENGNPTHLKEDNITIEGIVTVGKGVIDASKTIYVQDGTGGIAIYGSSLPDVKQGDKVRVTGKVDFYNGLTELTSGSDPKFIEILSSNNPLPAPQNITLDKLTSFSTAEPFEGMLVKTEAKVSSIPSSPASGGYNVKITDINGANEITLRVMQTSGIDPSKILQVGKTYTITGIVGQYDNKSPFTSGYQIFPRSSADIVEKQEVVEDKPLIYNVHPANMAFTYNKKPTISATFERGGANINPLNGNVTIKLDGSDVTSSATIDFKPETQKGSVTYTPSTELSYGEHDVTISVTDAVYRTAEYSWYFNVDDGVTDPKFFYGIPHSHTSYSDGQGTPADAYEHARSKGLDFLVVTDHSNSLQGDEYIEKTKEFLAKENSEWTKTGEMAAAFNQQHPDFLALRGFEMTSSDWGHINVHNTDKYVEAKKTMTGLREFYNWLENQPDAVAEFNHPNWPSDSFNNLGYVPEVDRILNLIETGNGAPPYSYSRAEEWYYRALDNGWHVGAVNAQDNHSMNWGDPDKLTVVVADELSHDEFIEALRERRVYSTETRTLELIMKANGYWMGSVLDSKDITDGKLNFEITAQDEIQPIDKLELVTNGGKVIDTYQAGGETDVSWNPSVTPGSGSHWYVVKVYHKSGKLGFSSPIFVAGGENDVKLVELKINPEPTLPNFDTTLTATVSNMGVRPVENLEVKFYQGSKDAGNLIDTVTIDRIAAGDKKEASVTWKPSAAGQTRIYAVLTPIENVTTVTELSKAVKVVESNGKKILVDQGHANSEVPGTHNDLMELLRRYGYNASFNTKTLTSDLLKDADVLILNTPTDYSKNLTQEEMDAVAAWVKAGGSLLLASKSNYQFEGSAGNNYHDGNTMLNALLAKMNSGIRLNNDNVYEPNSSENYSGGMKWSVYARTIPDAPSGLNKNLEAIRYFSGCSLVDENLKALTNDPASGIEILVAGNKTSYNFNVKPEYYTYNNAVGGENDSNQTAGPDGDKIPLIAKENIGSGRLVVAGRYFYSDYEIVNDVSNTAFTLRLIDWLAKIDCIRTIADVRKNAKIGDIVTVQGVVTSPTNNFFDTVYIQDETGGISLYGTQGKELPIGTVVIATGGVQMFEGEMELAYENADMEVLYVGPGTPVEPRKLSTKDAMNSQYTGMLVQTGGTITDVNEPASYFKIDDGSGEAYIHVDGYLGIDMSRLKVGDKYTVTGIASIGAAGPRVRVRFPTDLVKETTQEPQYWSLTIMHTNDTHAHLDDIAWRATVVKTIRSEAHNNLLLDAGDVFSGTLYFTKYQGQADIDLMNMLGYNAMGLGNHEFDKGPTALAEFINKAAFPIINSNFDFSTEPALSSLFKNSVGEGSVGESLKASIYPAAIVDVNGEKVGLIGVTTEDTGEISSPGDRIKINDAFVSAASAVDMLEDKGIDKIIAISHLGWDKDKELAEQVEGIDIIVGGHSHTKPSDYPAVITDAQYNTPTLVVQANEYGKYLGRLDVDFDDVGLVKEYEGRLIDVAAKDADGNYVYEEDQEFAEKLATYKAPLEELKNTVVGKTQVALDGARDNVRTKETNLGNLIADAMLEKASKLGGASMAITNGGGIRASIDEGDITLGEVLTVMPFGNTLVVLELTGEQIIAALENGVSQVEQKAGRFPQVAGLKFTWDPEKAVEQRIVDVKVKTSEGYSSINRSSRYLVATNNFMAGGGDGYTSFKEASKVIDIGFVDYEVFKEYLQQNSPVNPVIEGRISIYSPSKDDDSDEGHKKKENKKKEEPSTSPGVIPESELNVTTTDGRVKVEVTDEAIDKVLKQEGFTAVIDQQKAEGTQVNLSISATSMKKLAQKGIKVTVATPWAQVTVNPSSIDTQGTTPGAKVGITVEQVQKQEVQQLLKNLPDNLDLAGDVIDVNVTVEDKEQKIFEKPVRLIMKLNKNGQGNFFIYRIKEDGTLECLGGEAVKDENDKVIGYGIDLGHLSKYTVMEFKSKFTDIDRHWAKQNIILMAARDIAKGIEDTKFYPDQSITRAQFAALLTRMLKLESTASENIFQDVPDNAWFKNDIAAAYKAGIITGKDKNHFFPDQKITREEMATIIARAYNYATGKTLSGDGLPFTDSMNISPWAKDAVKGVYKLEIVEGMAGNLFAPKQTATRAQAIVMLKRLMDTLELY